MAEFVDQKPSQETRGEGEEEEQVRKQGGGPRRLVREGRDILNNNRLLAHIKGYSKR